MNSYKFSFLTDGNICFSSIIGAIFLLSFKYVDFGCFGVLIYLTMTTWIIFTEVSAYRNKIKQHMCEVYFKQGTVIYSLLQGKVFSNLMSIFVSFLMAFNFLLFVFLLDKQALLVMLLGVVLFKFTFTYTSENITEYFTTGAVNAYTSLFKIFINSLLLSIIYYVFDFITADVFAFNSDAIIDEAILNVQHSCKQFQDIARTLYTIQLNISSLRMLDGIGTYLASFIYIFTISLVPFFAYSIVLKKAVDFSILFTIKR